MPFSQGRVDGVVGLASEPSVELFVRGLPVWKGSVLEELSAREASSVWRADVGQGLAPMVKVNADSLTVVLSRTAVVDDAALAEVREVTRRAVERLVDSYLNRSLGRRIWGSAWAKTRSWVTRQAPLLGIVLGLGVLALVLVMQDSAAEGDTAIEQSAAQGQTAALEAEALSGQPDADPSETDLAPGPPPLVGRVLTEALGAEDVGSGNNEGSQNAGAVDYMALRARMKYLGSQVDQAVAPSAPFLTWSPEKRLYWRILATREFDSQRGFVGDVNEEQPLTALPGFTCFRGCVQVNLDLPQSEGRVVLPVPTGYQLVTQSVRVQGQPIVAFAQAEDMVVIETNHGVRQIGYEVGPAKAERSNHGIPAAPEATRWPKELLTGLDQACPGGVEGIRDYLQQELIYDASEGVQRSFQTRQQGSDWLGFVWELRRGDCDVLNGLAVLALDHCGIQARLAVGFAGAEGYVLPGLHAWAEYARPSASGGLEAWSILDLTQGAREASQPATEAPATSESPVVGESAQAVPVLRLADQGDVTGQAPAVADPGIADPAVADPARRVGVQLAKVPVEARAPSGVKPNAADDTIQVDAGNLPEGPASGLVPLWLPQKLASLSARGWAGVTAGILALSLLFGMLLASQMRRFRGKPVSEVSDGQAFEVVAKLALRALVQPNVWASASQLFKRPLLPTFAGTRISLSRALMLAARGRLFVASVGNGLVADVVGGRERVLKVEEGPLAEVVRRVPRALDLDQVESFSKVAEVGVAEEALAISRWLSQVWRPSLGRLSLRLLAYSSPAQPDVVRDFDLGALRFVRQSPWKGRVVAVNLATWGTRHRPSGLKAAGAPRFSAERAYDLAQHLTSHSLLLASRAAALRCAALEALLRSGWGGQP